MSQLKFITSAGIAIIIKAEKFFSKNNGEILLTNLPPQIKKVIQIIHSLSNLKMFKDFDEVDDYLLSVQKSEDVLS